MPWARLEEEPLDVAALSATQPAASVGAQVRYVGTVRGDDDGHPVPALDVEAYYEMALAQLVEIAHACVAEHGASDAWIVHRYGRVDAGQALVVVGIDAAHRKHAFAAAQWAMDEVKRRVPVWKRERGPAGRGWVPHETHAEAPQ